MEQFPRDITRKIFSLLDLVQLGSLLLVSRTIRQKALDPYLWLDVSTRFKKFQDGRSFPIIESVQYDEIGESLKGEFFFFFFFFFL